jgi:hypothetical protein
MPGDSVPGQVDATVQVLTGEQALAEYPSLFEDDAADGDYFNELGAHGNAKWVDYHPDLVVVVKAPNGGVLMTSNASEWHLKSCGYEVTS